MRPTKDQYMMKMARAAGSRATCNRGKSGAVIAVDGVVVSSGYVGAARGLPHCDEAGHLMREVIYEDGSKHRHCVSGDTLILKFQGRHYNSRHRTIADIHARWQVPKDRVWMRKMNVRCVSENGLIQPGKVLDVWKTEEKEVFEVRTFLGRTVKTSIDHRFLTENGWLPLEKISEGDAVGLNGQMLVDDASWLKERYLADGMTQAAIARLAGCSRGQVQRRLDLYEIPRRDLRDFALGGWNKWEENHSYKGREVIHDSSARERSRRLALGVRCAVCEGDSTLQVHHLDGDVRNDSLDNLVTLCVPCHTLAHSALSKREKVVFDKVVSIRPAGREPLYDMTTSHGNFVGNGVVLHNCVRTAHAEGNAIVQAAKRVVGGGTLYCKMEPCLRCTVDLINAGIKRVVADYRYHGAELSRKWLAMAGVALDVVHDEDAPYDSSDPEVSNVRKLCEAAMLNLKDGEHEYAGVLLEQAIKACGEEGEEGT